MNILNKVLGLTNIWKQEESFELYTPKETSSTFKLKYKDLIVGSLSIENGVWEFTYSEEFKVQNNIQPLADFPKKDKEYFAKELWPFFISRIPSKKTPSVQETARARNIDLNNEVEMLKEFGTRTITNPFLLVSQ